MWSASVIDASQRSARCRRWIGMLGLGTLVLAFQAQPAQAYVDPNSVGTLYQLLFPLLVAIASAFGALKRIAGRIWNLLATTAAAICRPGITRPDPDRDG